jgi:subtilisin-like proprotein convertase family protein
LPTLIALLLVASSAMGQPTRLSPMRAQPATDRPQAAGDALSTSYRSPSDRHKLRVFNADSVQRVEAAGATLVADYGSFAVYEIGTAALAAVQDLDGVELRDDLNRVELLSGAVDTAAAAAAPLQLGFEGRRLHIVQFAGPIVSDWYDTLTKSGVAVVGYLPSSAYVVYGDAQATERLQRLTAEVGGCQWLTAYTPAMKSSAAAGSDRFEIRLARDDERNPATMAAIMATGSVERRRRNGDAVEVVARIDAAAARRLCDREDVVFVVPYQRAIGKGDATALLDFFESRGEAPPSEAMARGYLAAFPGDKADRLDQTAAFDDAVRVHRDQIVTDELTASGQERVFTGVIGDAGARAVIAVGWTDALAPSTREASGIEVEVSVAGQTYRASPGRPGARAVILPAGATGQVSITVRGANIAATRQTTGALGQGFSLLATNLSGVEAVGGAGAATNSGWGANQTGPAPRFTSNFTNATAIAIPLTGTSGPASPYPSAISVSGITGSIAAVQVTLNGLTHTFPDDIDIMLAGPAGTNALIMSDVGGGTDVAGINITLSDTAASSLPDSTVLSSGTFRPTNIGVGDTFAPPAPAPSGGSALSVFNGTDPNGTWNLWVVDDLSGDTGSLTGGWTLTLITTDGCSAAVTINNGAASPYPATITLSGYTGTITKVRVTLNGLSHNSRPDDIDMLLVGPGGQDAKIMSDVGGTSLISNLIIVLDDAAPSAMPDSGSLTSQVFMPTDVNDGADSFPAPAPAPSGNTALSTFNGTSPNGTWSLYIVDDTNGQNGSLTSWCLSIEGVTPPCTITCPSNVIANADPGQCSALVNYSAPTTTGVCGGVTCTPASGSTFAVGTTTVNCTTGAGPSCSFTVTVNDTQAPTVACPANITTGNDAGQCNAVVNYATPTASDNCPGATVSCAPASGSTFSLGTTTVTCTATDAAGLTGTCTFTVTVNDTQAPTVTCPSNISTNTDVGQCTAVVSYTTPTASDNCPGATVACTPATGSTFNLGTTTVTCTATDAAGLTGTCTFTVTVTDVTPPTLSCPLDVTTSTAAGQCSAVVTYTTPTPSDNCPGTTVLCAPASGATFPVGTTTVTCTATDGSGNVATCSFDITVNDTQPPTITCPASQTVPENPPGSGGATVTYTVTASDNCSVTTSCVPASGSVFPVGTTTVNCTATDPSGNTGSCSFTVTVISCTITCPANVTQGNDAGQCGAVVNYPAPTTAGTCGTITCVPAAGSFFAAGTTTVNCSASAGPTCSFTVTVSDTEPPSITCPANVTQANDANQCSAVVNYGSPAVADNCAGVGTPVCSPASGSTFAVGSTTVTCSVADAVGNTAGCSFTVTVIDTQPPTVTCPGNMVVPASAGQCSATATYTATAADNCPGVTVSCSPASGSTFPLGATTVTCTASDGAGNTATCTFTVQVVDSQAPTITCPPNQTYTGTSVDPNTCTVVATVTYPAPTVTDNCPGATVACVPASGSPFPVGTTAVVCTATDASGNTASCSFTVTVTAGLGACYRDDVSGDTFQISTTAGPLFGFWIYKVANGPTFCGFAESVANVPGRSLTGHDRDDPETTMSCYIDYARARAQVTVVERMSNSQHNLRDRNINDNPACQ